MSTPMRASDHQSSPPRSLQASLRPRKMLVAVDGFEPTGRAVEKAIRLAGHEGGTEVVILSVVPRPEDWRLRGYASFKRAEVEDRLNELGHRAATNAAARLHEAGISNTILVKLGDPVDEIGSCAEELGCELIVIGVPRPGRWQRWMLRNTGLSFASKSIIVAQLAELPVLLVK